jgi:hypothetical protein
MHCFRHTERPAHAICVECGRGVCSDCSVVASAERVTCSDACAANANRFRQMIDSIAKKTMRGSLVAAWFLWLSGAVFLIVGIGTYVTMGIFASFPIALAAVFFIAGYWYFKVSRRDA